MAISSVATSVYFMNEPPKQATATPFFQTAYTADASGCETVKAAVTGYSIVITHLTVGGDGNITVTIGEGESVPGTPDTVLVGPLVLTETGMVYDLHLPNRSS